MQQESQAQKACTKLWEGLLKRKQFFGYPFYREVEVGDEVWHFHSPDLKMLIQIEEEGHGIQRRSSDWETNVVQGLIVLTFSPRQILDEFETSIDHITEVFYNTYRHQCGN